MNTDDIQESCPTTRWNVQQIDEMLVSDLAAATGLSRVVARIMAVRGISTPEEARRFLEPDLACDWLDPALIPGMSRAADAVASAITARKRIVVFGDFDLDGISSAAVAARGLKALGGDVRAVVPNRFREGYGLTQPAIERLLSMGAETVITVDCGISADVEVRALLDAGVDVIVTDHHEPGDAVPATVPVANPKLDPSCPSCDLAGAGVALKLVQAVGAIMGSPDLWLELTDLAMLGTIADIVPLKGENRALVAEGLSRVRRHPRVCISALCAVAGVSAESLTAEGVAFGLAPRLNAAGRMGDPGMALDLLLTDDPMVAEQAAAALDDQNKLRQAVEQDLSEAAAHLAERHFTEGDRVIVVWGEGWHEGVKGIVASRLASRFGVPVLLFAVDGEYAQGSGRSAGSVDLFGAVGACSELLIRFGGHAAAVGATLRTDDLPEFKERLAAHLAQLPAAVFETPSRVDAEIELAEASVELAAELAVLEPFGHGNPRPRFVSTGVFMNSRQRVGRSGDHLRFTAFDGIASVQAIAFRCPEIEQNADHDAGVNVVFEVVADEWRGRTRVQLHVRDVERRQHEPLYAPAAQLVEDLFEHADRIIAREEYSGIEDADSFHTKLAGVSFEGRQEIVARLEPGTPLRLERQPDNEYDSNAIAVFDPKGAHIGFLNRRLANVLASVLDTGIDYDAEVTDITGGLEGRSLGVNVLLSRRSTEADERDTETLADRRSGFASLPDERMTSELVSQFIGDRKLHDAQTAALEALDGGKRCLTVMATGRGKSLIFHLHAARLALRSGLASVFVFPLRALVADQAFHLEESFARIGLCVSTLTGESPPASRDATFAALADGEIDVVLTTPEFLDHHAARFAATRKIGFVVVDEAHHVGMARASHRPAYTRFGQVLETLGSPGVLAVTATAGDDVAATIVRVLGIETVVTDPTVRENLLLEDRRGQSSKDDYLAALAARGEKMIVYVNSREQSVRLARMLRKRVPHIAMRTAFYNGGLNRSARHAVERAFRGNDISVVIATSAFGEGVNIPDIRHVILYHLPFNDIEFNQMCGRAGRDGAAARIHPLFGPKDGKVNEIVLSSVAPQREDMAALYTELKDIAGREGDGFEITNAELAERVTARRGRSSINDRGVSSALGVFRELGFVEGEGSGSYRRLTLLPPPAEKVDLATSVRYAEGLEEIEEFNSFRSWVLEAPAGELLARFNRPILPST